jgi:hypothetical protein
MAYMDDQAIERERTKQKMLEGKTPLLGADTQAAINALLSSPDALSQLQKLIGPSGGTPKGVAQTPTNPLQVMPGDGRRVGGGEATHYKDDSPDLGGVLKGLLDKAKDGGLRGQKKALEDARGASAPSASLNDMVRRGKPDMPKGPTAGQLIPGLKPGIDATKAPPGAAAAEAYITEKTPGPAVSGTPTGTYKDDLRFLQERGGHTSVVKDGKITHTPMDAPGSYGAVDPELAARLRHAGEAYEKETGKKAQYGEFSRGEDVQAHYWKESEGGKKYAAAPPGRSHHQKGTAGDLPAGGFRDWLNAGNKDKYGLHFPVKNDAPHVEANPRHRQTFANTTTSPTAPAWDTSEPPPQADANTKWPGADAPTAAAAVPKPEPGTRTLASTAQPAATEGGHATLAEQRAEYKAMADSNPALRDKMAAIMMTESSTPAGRQGVAEAMMNRVKSTGRPFTDAMDPAYHDQMHDGSGRYEAALKKIQSDPQLRAELHGLQDKAFGGSNITNLATDYASGGVAANSSRNSTKTFASPDGQQFFRKDTNPGEHGAANVRNIQDWHKKTDAAIKSQPAPAASAQASAANPTPGPAAEPAQSPPSEPAPASAFEKGAAAVPQPGVGGMYGPEFEASTTGATLPGPGTEELNAIKAPERPPNQLPPVVVDAPSAPAPAPAAARTAAPVATAAAAPAAPRPAPPAAPPANPAHRYLDMKTPEFAETMQKGASSQIPGMLKDMTVREVMNHPLYGGMAKSQLGPALDKVGITPRQFQDAIKEGPPKVGKRSDYGTSGATEFSSQNRRSLAPPGLDGATIDPASQPAVQNADGSISTVNTMGVGIDGKEVNIPRVPAEGGRVMTEPEAIKRYEETGNHLGKYDTPEEAGRAAEALHQNEAREISQHPQGQQPTITPEMAQAIENAMKDQERMPQAAPPPPEAQPVLPPEPIQMPGAAPGGAPGGLSLAPVGLQQGGVGGSAAFMPAGTQGGSIAMAGMLPPIQNSTFSSPLLDSMAQGPGGGSSAFNAGSFMPISLDMLGGLGWGGGSGFGSGSMGGGFDFGGGGGFDMGGGGMGGGFTMPMSFGGGG